MFNKCKKLPHWRHGGCERSEDADGAIKEAICGGFLTAQQACVKRCFPAPFFLSSGVRLF
ncbi:MAG TPA: hypothetical protein DCO75_12555 [Fibrobacteres bacterium]|nr:hypothetical protein [Fibrobacterota bacterium]